MQPGPWIVDISSGSQAIRLVVPHRQSDAPHRPDREGIGMETLAAIAMLAAAYGLPPGITWKRVRSGSR